MKNMLMKKILVKNLFLQTCLCLLFSFSAAACSTASSSRTDSSPDNATIKMQTKKTNQPQTDNNQINNHQTNTGQKNKSQLNKRPENTKQENKIQPPKAISRQQKPTEKSTHVQRQQALKRMLVFDGKYYIETGETSSIPRCGMMDAQIQSMVSAGQIPQEELQSNFGEGYGLQYGSRKNRIEVCIDDKWLVFACNENNLDGVTMEVSKNTSHSAELTITNTTDQNIQFGEDYELETKNETTGEWNRVEYLIDDYGFNDPAFLTEKNVPVTWRTDWTVFHGKLKPGTYRIIKDFLDVRKNSDYTTYTLMAEFTVS